MRDSKILSDSGDTSSHASKLLRNVASLNLARFQVLDGAIAT